MVHLKVTLHDGEGMLVSVTSEIGEVRQIKEIIQKDPLASAMASEVEAEEEGDSGNPGVFDLDDREDEDKAELFTITPHDTPKIDPIIACHWMIVNASVRYVSHRQRRESPKKSDATASTIKGLLDAHFVLESKYT
ncbi:hypothetical protein KIW84_013457 [Lathyrus oleraceus]|uniref:Uncharacterized protein n=1 Tax=Pisum sativum TaxID=3888 RepID=A0A9D5BKE3_PEA|nr:hypothetical protein KIW84_013457 [Pisum sativum]